MSRLIRLLAALLLAATPAAAQQLTLEIHDGRVSLDARAVPVRQILAEWAKVGGTTVVNGERVAGAPLTITLVDVPERQALEIVLRNVAGYMAAPRRANATPGASVYDRIMVLPTSATPPASAAAARPAAPRPDPRAGLQRFVPPRPPIVRAPGDPGEEPTEEMDETDQFDEEPVQPGQPVFAFPGGDPQEQPPGTVFAPVQPGAFGAPAAVPAGGYPAMPPQEGLTVSPGGAVVPGAPTAPLGSPVPGVITNPAPAQGGQVPPRPTRPPGQP
ncbi:MAG: hypothetical protein AB1635_09120 [Acidobacteriota bacterium]